LQFVMIVNGGLRQIVLVTALLQLLETLRSASLYCCAYVVYKIDGFMV
jgi:hypothetical protein